MNCFKNTSEFAEKGGRFLGAALRLLLTAVSLRPGLRPRGGQWRRRRCSPRPPASSPPGRWGGSSQAPSAGPGSLAGWEQSSCGGPASPQHWHSAGGGTVPPRSRKGIYQGPHCGCREDRSQEESEFWVSGRKSRNEGGGGEREEEHRMTKKSTAKSLPLLWRTLGLKIWALSPPPHAFPFLISFFFSSDKAQTQCLPQDR